MSRASDEARRRWKELQNKPGSTADKMADWNQAKSENEKVHVHFFCKCNACAQEFSICGLPCFIICPNCHLILRLRFA